MTRERDGKTVSTDRLEQWDSLWRLLAEHPAAGLALRSTLEKWSDDDPDPARCR
jgi:hypothetical protein